MRTAIIPPRIHATVSKPSLRFFKKNIREFLSLVIKSATAQSGKDRNSSPSAGIAPQLELQVL